ncbi:hypothetical protein BGW36DRAFT_424919 [Talaromyces proteolyticus]|uniref:Zn(2)-C6 fungal-type domain-containing protein n=1 Tax=Talaromyces proteolyticus TaxID=1131652 RepID=A0AAD4KSG5_9EURO|nr:uncharacterized protein BGW36DRAFT_424919 [Talaromyces proteolyticus]KAH8700078.1 hypothetical protein BGW36DRAFT_424919 [Talaromyces proteolyticus]
MSFSIYRKRLACVECTRRKVRCDKTLPCRNCTVKGINCSRPRDHIHSAAWACHPRLHYSFASPISPRNRKLSGLGGGDVTNLDPSSAPYDDYLEALLPSKHQIYYLVDYHELYLLWYHGSYHGPTFQCELQSAIRDETDGATLDIAQLDLQWIALLFSIMVASLVCAPSAEIEEWGFHCVEVSELAAAWFKACINCLNKANYSAKRNIYSVQAIATLAMSAHILDQSAELSVLRGAATQIARGLGLDQLSHDARVDIVTSTSSEADKYKLLQRDTGRRLWFQLCVQDWISLPFSESHIIDPLQFTSCKPANRNFLTMDLIDENCPTYVSYTNYLFQIAKLMAKHHEAVLRSSTLLTKYEHTLDYDYRLRTLATKAMPKYFHIVEPIDPVWPDWIPWARRSLTICFAHKMIMIHRAFLRKSFENAAFSATQSTCLAAAKTILKEVQTRDMEGPTIWIDEAYCASAGVVLCLDILHRPPTDTLFQTHVDLARGCISRLHRCSWSNVAGRGARVLTVLLDKIGAGTGSIADIELSHALEMTGHEQLYDIESVLQGDLAEVFPPPAGMRNKYLFGELLQIKHLP